MLVKAFGEICKVGQMMSSVVTMEERFGAGGTPKMEQIFILCFFFPSSEVLFDKLLLLFSISVKTEV